MLKQLITVTHLVEENSIQANWILENGISHYHLFSSNEKRDFIEEVEGSEKYVHLIDWSE